jgi:hypothetical protein
MKFQVITDDYVLGQIRADQLPECAANALEEGYDSPALCQLAAASVDNSERLQLLFSEVLEELRIPVPSRTEAALKKARTIAAEILNGQVSHYKGAKQIWNEVYVRYPELSQLRVFVGLASEYEDDTEHRSDYEWKIIEECNSLLAIGAY